MSVKAYVDLARPFTLLPPALGVLSGAVTAWGSAHAGKPPITWDLASHVVWGTLMAAVLNAGNNAINQIYDLDIDRVNKPKRPLPAGALTLGQAWGFTIASFLLAWLLAWLVNPVGRRECFWIVIFTSVLCWAYSAPPLWTKRRGFLANITIAIPRGVLLKVAGWSTVLSVLDVEPWYIGSVFGLFLLGAASTKDFSDMEGDRAGGCTTLPIVYGVKKAAWIIAPFFVFPFALIPIGVALRILTGNPVLLNVLGITLVLYGGYTVYLLVRRPEELAATENHPSWTHMYRMMMVAQIGFALAYVF
jgi:4-hydroxybenzoate polyprenyltransferase